MSTSLIIRADATADIGGGHIMRCLALANAWREQTGTPAQFVTHCSAESMCITVAEHGHYIANITSGDGEDIEPDFQNMLERYPDAWVVIDGYEFKEPYYAKVRATGHRVLAIDDMVRLTEYDVDAICNPNVYAPDLSYPTTTPCKELLGAAYCLLRKEFVATTPLKVREPVEHILLTMGAADAENYTNVVLSWLADIDLSIRVLAGPANPNLDSLQQLAQTAANVEIVVNPQRVSKEMQWADIAIAAAGSTMWELCRLGIPSITTATADNQLQIAKHLGSRGAAITLAPMWELKQEALIEALRELRTNQTKRQTLADTAATLVDGRGAFRVVDSLRGL